MKYLITKTVITMKKGDKIILREKVLTNDIEQTRTELNEKYSAKNVCFVYEELR